MRFDKHHSLRTRTLAPTLSTTRLRAWELRRPLMMLMVLFSLVVVTTAQTLPNPLDQLALYNEVIRPALKGEGSSIIQCGEGELSCVIKPGAPSPPPLMKKRSIDIRITGIHLNFASLNGSIPTEIGLLTSFQTLSLHSNKLKGTLPSELGQLNQLVTLAVSNNLLSGSIPNEFGGINRLGELVVVCEVFGDPTPESSGSDSNCFACINGEVINPSNCSFFRDFDCSCQCATNAAELTQLELFNWVIWPALSGKGPGEYQCNQGFVSCDDSAIIALDLSGFELSGSIPTEIGMLTSLLELHLGNNLLTGTIPSELGKISNTGLLLLLNNNLLEGTIPTELRLLSTRFTSASLKLDHNRLCSEIPVLNTHECSVFSSGVYEGYTDQNCFACHNDTLINPSDCDISGTFDCSCECFGNQTLATQSPTPAPTAPTGAPTVPPTSLPTQTPTLAPTQLPSRSPTKRPTHAPTTASSQGTAASSTSASLSVQAITSTSGADADVSTSDIDPEVSSPAPIVSEGDDASALVASLVVTVLCILGVGVIAFVVVRNRRKSRRSGHSGSDTALQHTGTAARASRRMRSPPLSPRGGARSSSRRQSTRASRRSSVKYGHVGLSSRANAYTSAGLFAGGLAAPLTYGETSLRDDGGEASAAAAGDTSSSLPPPVTYGDTSLTAVDKAAFSSEYADVSVQAAPAVYGDTSLTDAQKVKSEYDSHVPIALASYGETSLVATEGSPDNYDTLELVRKSLVKDSDGEREREREGVKRTESEYRTLNLAPNESD